MRISAITAVAVALLVEVSSMPGATRGQPQRGADRISLPVAGPAAARHPITLEEIVRLREPQSPAISPDGTRIAFIVRQAVLDTNAYRAALFIVDADGSEPPKKVVERDALSPVQWSRDGRSLLTLSAPPGQPSQVVRLDPATGAMTPLTRHATAVRAFQISEDGGRIVFTAKTELTAKERARLYDEGVLWRDGYDFLDVTEGGHLSKVKPVELWVHDTGSGTERRLWEHPSLESFDVSPDGRHVAVVYRPSSSLRDQQNRDLGLVDVEAGRFTPLVEWPLRDAAPSWSPDSRSLAFVSMGALTPEETRANQMNFDGDLYVHSFPGSERRKVAPWRVLSSIDWTPDGRRFVTQAGDRHNSWITATPSGGGPPERLSAGADHLSACSYSTDFRRAACIRQTTMMPPEIAVVDLPGGEPRTLTHLNPEYGSIMLGEVTKLEWTNKLGDPTHGYLIKPVGYQASRRYPFIMVLYGFENKFISQAQWISGSPAQRFAAEGFVVMLTNYPSTKRQWRWGDFESAAHEGAWSPLASMDRGVAMLDEMGLIDRTRAGVMGLSYGSFLTDFAMTQSTLFSVASSLDGGRENVMRYVLEGTDFWHHGDGYFGGTPFGPAYENWKQISPALNAARANGPILMQYAKRIWGLEFYTAMRTCGKPVELVFYPDEAHIFQVPSHRLSSMRQNLDWFRFWLKQEVDPAPEKAAQYQRWRAMQTARTATGGARPGPAAGGTP